MKNEDVIVGTVDDHDQMFLRFKNFKILKSKATMYLLQCEYALISEIIVPKRDVAYMTPISEIS